MASDDKVDIFSWKGAIDRQLKILKRHQLLSEKKGDMVHSNEYKKQLDHLMKNKGKKYV